MMKMRVISQVSIVRRNKQYVTVRHLQEVSCIIEVVVIYSYIIYIVIYSYIIIPKRAQKI